MTFVKTGDNLPIEGFYDEDGPKKCPKCERRLVDINSEDGENKLKCTNCDDCDCGDCGCNGIDEE